MTMRTGLGAGRNPFLNWDATSTGLGAACSWVNVGIEVLQLYCLWVAYGLGAGPVGVGLGVH